MENFRKIEDIEVKLVGAIRTPYELAVATARTCYSGKGVIYPEDVSKDEKAVELRDRIASSTLEAGHLTTRQHAHFVFSLSGVSRQFIWSFLHGHPFYNSEQVSQRYVRVKQGNVIMPPLPEAARPVYAETVAAQMAAYESLIEVLREPLASDFFQRFPARRKLPEKWKGAIDKRAFEVARYVLGLGTTAYLYHTVSALTLLRYAKLMDLFDTPDEQRVVVRRMIDAVKAYDPLFEKEMRDPLPLDKTLEYQMVARFHDRPRSPRFADDFDRKLEGRVSKLVGYSHGAETLLADAIRVALGRIEDEMSDDEALSLALDPKNNPILADTLNVSTLDKLSQVFHHVHFTFHKKLSHAADSQDQRHRTVLASRPLVQFHYGGKPDYLTPFGVTQSERASEIYTRAMELTFRGVNRLLDLGVPMASAQYLLPNAFPIRMVSTGDLHSYLHKWKLRTCYNAQEEIFRASLDEISQVRALYPKLGEHLRAPCYFRLRAGIKPFCPEGDKFCGLPVWKYDIPQYVRKSL